MGLNNRKTNETPEIRSETLRYLDLYGFTAAWRHLNHERFSKVLLFAFMDEYRQVLSNVYRDFYDISPE